MELAAHSEDLPNPSRRAFTFGLASIVAGCLWSRPRDARAAPTAAADGFGTADHVIYIFLAGGMSHIDTLDPKPGTPNQGPVKSVETGVSGVRLSQHFSRLASHMDKLAVIRSMTTSQGAHREGTYFAHTSYPLRGLVRHPSLGAWAEHFLGRLNDSLPGHVAIGGGSHTASRGFFDARLTPLVIGDLALPDTRRAAHVDLARFEHRLERLNGMNTAFREVHPARAVADQADVYGEALRLMQSKDLAAFDISQEPAVVRKAYGDSRIGRSCLLARRLVESGVRFVEIVSGGWDTHSDNFAVLDELCPPTDQAFSALLGDLSHRGLLARTLVVVTTEFGRSPNIADGAGTGRGHHPQAYSSFLAGGGIVGGRAYGKTDEEGRRIIENPVTVPDFNATIAHALGMPSDRRILDPSGRPFQAAGVGKPVTKLFG